MPSFNFYCTQCDCLKKLLLWMYLCREKTVNIAAVLGNEKFPVLSMKTDILRIFCTAKLWQVEN